MTQQNTNVLEEVSDKSPLEVAAWARALVQACHASYIENKSPETYQRLDIALVSYWEALKGLGEEDSNRSLAGSIDSRAMYYSSHRRNITELETSMGLYDRMLKALRDQVDIQNQQARVILTQPSVKPKDD